MGETNQVNDFSSYEGSPLEKRIIAILKACHYGGVAFVVAMMFMTAVHTIGRYGFDKPLLGLVDISKYALIATVFLTCAYTMVVKGHISIGIIVDRLSPRAQAIIDFITYFLCLLFAIVALWQAFVQGFYLMPTMYGSFVLRIPAFPFYLLIAVGWGLLGMATVMHLVNAILKVAKK